MEGLGGSGEDGAFEGEGGAILDGVAGLEEDGVEKDTGDLGWTLCCCGPLLGAGVCKFMLLLLFTT